MCVASLGIEVIVLRQVELFLLVCFCLYYCLGIAVLLCLVEGQLAEVTADRVICRGVWFAA